MKDLDWKRLKMEGKITKQLGVQVNKEQWRKFRSLAVLQDRTAADLLEEAMAEYLEKHESPGK